MKDERKTKKQLIEELDGLRREMVVEQALERVRGVALGMRRSEDIGEVAAAVFREAREVGMDLLRAGIEVFDEESDTFEYWGTSLGGDVGIGARYCLGDSMGHPILRERHEARRRGDAWYHSDPSGEDLVSIVNYAIDCLGLPLREWRSMQPSERPGFDHLHLYWIFYSHGDLYVPSAHPLTDGELGTMQRLAAAFGFAWTRYLELQQAEEHARQAERRAAVDRVRAEIATMRTSADLEDLTPLIWRELTGAGVSFFRCGVFIATEEGTRVQTYLTNPQGESLGVLDLGDDSHPFIGRVLGSWRVAQVHIEQWDQPTFLEWMDFLQAQGQDVERGRYLDAGDPPESLSLQFVPFAQGMLYVGSAAPLPKEDLSLVQEVATAFSVAYARYLDFEQLEAQNREIQQNTRNKSEFLSRMSHDLRTPMNAIIGYTRILTRRLKGAIEDRQFRNLENIQTSATNLLNLINEILDLSRIEAGRIDLNPEPVDLGELVKECITSVAPLVKPEVALVQDLGDVPSINTDADRIRRVVMNLLGNAVKFTEEGSITVSLKPVESGVELAVTDTGVGIPADDLPHIFKDFHQVERQVGEKVEGTGLGLAIAAMSVQMLGGTISAESELGKGTTFTVRIGDYAGPTT